MSFSLSSLPVRVRRALIAAAALVTLAAAWAGWWQLAAVVVEQKLAAKIAASHQRGDDIHYGKLEIDGFPLAIRASLTEVAIRHHKGATARLPRVVVEAPLWQVTALKLTLEGKLQVWLPGDGGLVALSADRGEGAASLGGSQGLTAASLRLTGLAAAATALGPVPATAAWLEFKASAPSGPVADHTETGLTVTAAAERIDLPLAGTLTLGPTIGALSGTARVLGPPPHPVPEQLRAWSVEGGTVELDDASLRWGPLALAAKGTLALDRDLQPMAALTTEITGFAAAIDALITAGLVKPKDALAVKAVLTGLVPRHEGAALPKDPTARIPISVHDHHVYVGPFRLIPLPPVVWQAPAAG